MSKEDRGMRQFLERNEIYFKVAAYLLLPLAGVFVAVQANSISSYQAQIAAEQSMILKRQQLPVINMTSKLKYDQGVGKYTDDVLEIYNGGSPLRDLSIDKGIFIIVEYGKEGSALDKALIPLYDYYLGTVYSGISSSGTSGLVGTGLSLKFS